MSMQDNAGATGTARVLAGRYALGERLGRGGMGTVWRARDEMLDREVAVKELTVSHLDEEELEILQSRMKREARAAARIKHPGVITIHDVLEQDGRPWIVMELVDGRSLSDVINQDGPLAPREAAEVGVQVLAALHRGHQLGVLHRDVKPANVLLEHGTGRAVLLDFGIAKFEGSTELTRPGDLVGSPDYLAPERAQGGRPGPASDLWGLGATLYAAVEGQSPFRRDSPINTLAAVVDEPLPEPRRAGALGPVLRALLAKDPADRPSADEALRMLGEVKAGHTVSIGLPKKQEEVVEHRVPTQAVPVVDRTVSEPEAGRASAESVTGATEVVRPRRRRTALVAVLVLLAVAALGAGGVYLVQRLHQQPDDPQPPVPVTPSPTVEPSTPTTTASDSPAPAGYEWTQDPDGFRFPLPTGQGTWTRTTDDGGNIYYTYDNRDHYLQFAKTVGQTLSPRAHFQDMERSVSTFKDYRRITMADTKVHNNLAAVWEFSYTSKDGPKRHAKEAEFVAPDGTSYDIYISSLDKPNDWKTAEHWFNEVLNDFTPTR